MTAADPVRRRIEAVWKIESAKLIGALARIVRDVGTAEELAQDALVSAMEQWPVTGIPENPAAWLMSAAKRRGIDILRRRRMQERKHVELGHAMDTEPPPDLDAALDDDVGDDLLRLIFVSCHPVLSPDARVSLTLRLLGGLTTDEIARAFLAPEPTIAQRIVRAKKTLAEAEVPFEVPRAEELVDRLASVLEVVYLVFNEGYSATRGDDLMRPALCEEALRLGRVLVGLLPSEPEAHGLLALMELHVSRSKTRTGPNGEPVLLLDQARGRWDQLHIRRGLEALARAEELGGARGFYTLQAAISACHARAREASQTDWARIASLYGELVEITGSPIVELNRAVAIAMAEGPEAGLAILDEIASEPALRGYYLLFAARGDMLEKLGRAEAARGEFEKAASMTQNEKERALMLDRASRLAVATGRN